MDRPHGLGVALPRVALLYLVAELVLEGVNYRFNYIIARRRPLPLSTAEVRHGVGFVLVSVGVKQGGIWLRVQIGRDSMMKQKYYEK